MNSIVRTKSAACLLLADPGRTVTPHRYRACGDPGVRPFRFRAIGRLDEARRSSPAMEIGVIPNVIAMALAQLVRDRWAVEQRELEERGGRLHALVTKECQ
jgi:hypothetical protein